LLTAGNDPASITARFATQRPFKSEGPFLGHLNDRTITDLVDGIEASAEAASAMIGAVECVLEIISSPMMKITHRPDERLARRVAQVCGGAQLKPWVEIPRPRLAA
jgi:hypothetical protein